MRGHARVYLAISVALVAGIVAAVSIYRSVGRANPRPQPPAVKPDVQAFFAALTGTLPTSAETWASTEAAARASLSAQVRGLDARRLPATAALAETFTGELRAMLGGDFDSYVERMRQQGIRIEQTDASRAAWLAAAKLINWTALDANAIAVRIYALNGVKQPPPEGRKRLGTTNARRKPGSSTLPESPDTTGLTILEVEIPMAIAVGPDVSVKKPRIVQFRYAWNKELLVWSLWDMGTLIEPGDRGYMWPL